MNRNGILLIVFGALIAIYLGNKYFSGNTNRNFREELTSVDSTKVTQIVILTKDHQSEPIKINKVNNSWEVTNGQITDDANKNGVKGMLLALQSMVPKRLVANSEDKWAQYEVNDSLGTKVKVFNKEHLLADVIIGKFDFNQNTRTASTYVRVAGENETYSVDGFLSSNFNKEFNNFRDGTFLKVEPSYLTGIRYDYLGDSSFVLNKVDSKWQINGTKADSAAVQNYFNGLKNLVKHDFVDDFKQPVLPTYSMTLSGNNMRDITLDAYESGDEIILHSSMNTGAYFSKGNLAIFEKLFIDKNHLLK